MLEFHLDTLHFNEIKIIFPSSEIKNARNMQTFQILYISQCYRLVAFFKFSKYLFRFRKLLQRKPASRKKLCWQI